MGSPENDDTIDFVWTRVEHSRESLEAALQDLKASIESRSLPRLSSAMQSFNTHAFRLAALYGELAVRTGLHQI